MKRALAAAVATVVAGGLVGVGAVLLASEPGSTARYVLRGPSATAVRSCMEVEDCTADVHATQPDGGVVRLQLRRGRVCRSVGCPTEEYLFYNLERGENVRVTMAGNVVEIQ